MLSNYQASWKAPMDRTEWSLQEAKNSFSAVVEAASRGAPQLVTKRGKPAVIVLSVSAYRQLTRKTEPRGPSFVEHLLAMPKGKVGFERIPIEPGEVDF
jgi:prevent-host-death family protein